MAEDERKRIKERQEEGIKAAINKDTKFGRKKIEVDENSSLYIMNGSKKDNSR